MTYCTLEKLKATKEYVVWLPYGYRSVHIVVKKIVKNTQGEILEIHYHNLATNKDETTTTFDLITEPVTATEFFTMYTNWNNHYKEGIHQDVEFASIIAKRIHETLRKRSFVFEGVGKFEPFDYRLLTKFKDLT